MNLSTQAGGQPVLLPELLEQGGEGGTCVLSLRIPEDLAYFPGHFPQVAVVPGVTQIHWALYFARRHWPALGRFSHMEAIKFKELLLPGQRLELVLRHLPQAHKLEFRYRSQTAEYGSGRIYFHGETL